MDFELSDEQRAIALACEAILGQLAGVQRAMALAERDAYDASLENALAEAGFLEVALGDGTGALEAALVT